MTKSRRRDRAIAALLSERSVEAAAKVANVPARTLHRWLATDAEFQAAYRTASQQVLVSTVTALRAASAEAVELLRATVTNKEESGSVRVRAAQVILDTAFKNELDELAARIAALEAESAAPVLTTAQKERQDA